MSGESLLKLAIEGSLSSRSHANCAWVDFFLKLAHTVYELGGICLLIRRYSTEFPHTMVNVEESAVDSVPSYKSLPLVGAGPGQTLELVFLMCHLRAVA